MNEPSRWVFFAGFAHVLADDAGDNATLFITVCGREAACTGSVYRVAPSLNVCHLCKRIAALDVPPAEFPTTPTVF